MKTLIAMLLATVVASPVLAQENDRNGSPGPVRAQVTTTAPGSYFDANVANAYARVGNVPASQNTDPDPFIRSQLPRDAYAD